MRNRDTFESAVVAAGVGVGLISTGYLLAHPELPWQLYPLAGVLVAVTLRGQSHQQARRMMDNSHSLLRHAHAEIQGLQRALKNREKVIEMLSIALRTYEGKAPQKVAQKGGPRK